MEKMVMRFGFLTCWVSLVSESCALSQMFLRLQVCGNGVNHPPCQTHMTPQHGAAMFMPSAVRGEPPNPLVRPGVSQTFIIHDSE